MDPNVNLKEQREIIAKMIELEDSDLGLIPKTADYIELSAQLVQRMQDLDEWISKGGALPDAWRHRTPLVAA